jgi:uncharacterized protein (UPF0548 family)
VQVIRRGSSIALSTALGHARFSAPTWTGPLTLPPPVGFIADEVRRSLGTGDDAFEAATDRILTWGVQRHSGLTVLAETDRAQVGTTFVVGLPFGPAWVLAPCRVIEMSSTPTRTGLTFVTLTGHPECGIEEFAVVRTDDGAVSFEISAISRPVSLPARVGKPVTRRIQVHQTRKYLAAITAGG